MEWILTQVNMMGKAFVGLTVPMLLTSTVLIGLVLLVESVLRERVRAGLRYWLVTCVLAYMVLIPLLSFNPPSTHWPTGGGSLIAILRVWGPQTAYAEGISDATSLVEDSDPTSLTPSRHTHAPLSQPTTGQSQTTTGGAGERPRTFLPEAAHRLRGPVSWQGTVFLLWLTGVVIMGGVLIRRARGACARLERIPAANNLMNDILIYCRRRMGVHGTVCLKVSPAGTRPAVCGLLRPVIIVPRNLAPTLGSRHLRDVLFHQLAHIKRHDLWVNLAQNILQVVYFYNPLILVVNAAIRRLREEAANETVLATIGDPDHLYAQRLSEVETITLRDPPPSLYLIGIA
jgi:beta-lactamase regulating signal transducer with metallopeptidase domain